MSHEIVMGVRIKKDTGEVWFNSDSNNTYPRRSYPRRFSWWKSEHLSEVLVKEGEKAAISEILRLYWEGNFHAGRKNKYYYAVRLFNDDHPGWSWRTVGEVKHRDLATGPLEDLPKYMNSYDPKVKDIVTRRLNGETVDPDSIEEPAYYTYQELKDMLYEYYVAYSNRKRGKYTVAGVRRKTFTSREDAIDWCKSKHYINYIVLEV